MARGHRGYYAVIGHPRTYERTTQPGEHNATQLSGSVHVWSFSRYRWNVHRRTRDASAAQEPNSIPPNAERREFNGMEYYIVPLATVATNT